MMRTESTHLKVNDLVSIRIAAAIVTMKVNEPKIVHMNETCQVVRGSCKKTNIYGQLFVIFFVFLTQNNEYMCDETDFAQ